MLLDGPALNSPMLGVVQGVVYNPTDGSFFFIDHPRSVLRIRSDGILLALALLSPPTSSVPIDGPFVNATASNLIFLSLSTDSKTLYVSDAWWPFSVVRGIDIASGTITRVAGSVSGTTTGNAPLNVAFNHFITVRPFAGGNLLLVDDGAGVLRSVIFNEFRGRFLPFRLYLPLWNTVAMH